MAANNDPFCVGPSYMLREGLKMVHVDLEEQERRCLSTNVRVFKSHFGKHPLHLCRVHRDLQIAGHMARDEAMSRNSFLAFMLSNNFLRCYETADLRHARFSINLDDLKDFIWDFVGRIAALKPFKIKCPNIWPVKLGASVDGTHVKTNEPRDPDMRRNPENYSYKHNFAGLNYQIVLSLWTNHVWCATSGDPASTHDMAAIRAEFIAMVPEGCRVLADTGFIGKTEAEKRVFSIRNNLDDDEVAALKAKGRARQEQFNKRMKDYQCLVKPFHHDIRKHVDCFNAVLALVQCAIEDASDVGEPLDTL